ncbi:abnormal spindle-like microcephaly-associated protein [Molossus nigricans]
MATRRRGGDASPTERGPPPLLVLSHFCPRPFLCFGDVRPGASRTLPLAVLNPNAEAAAVTLPRGPAAERGFQVWPRAFELQPKEKIVISINWTPLKEGRIREIVTFLVNDVLKHEVIVLGNAEGPKKKKRSLWDTINKKKVSASSNHKKRISNTQNVNKTFSVSQKVDRVRSPLQACENLGGREGGCSPTENNSLILEENKIPISPISPTFKECHGDTSLPLCVRRSTAYSSLDAHENGELWQLGSAHISEDFNEKVITGTSINIINGQMEEGSKLILSPNCSSTLNLMQSHGDFLSPDSFVKNSQAVTTELEPVPCISSDAFLKGNSRSMHLESKTVHEIYQTILSPDSFLKDNYGPNRELESESVNPIVSPNQFVKDNMPYISISQQICKLSPLAKENSQASQSLQGQRKSEVLLYIPECQGSNSPKAIFEEPKALEMKTNRYSFTKQNQPKFSAVQDIPGHSHNTHLKKRPILSATVTKSKPAGTRENKTEASKPKARKCLRSVAGEGEETADNPEEKDAFHSCLPVIDPVVSRSKDCKKVVTPSSQTPFIARKRKSEGDRRDVNMIPVVKHTEEQEAKRLHFPPGESETSAAKKTKMLVTPVPQHVSKRGRTNLKKKTDSLAYRTPNSKTNQRTQRFVPVAQSSLTLIKRLKTGIPRHPMPFAAKNMFYDERWKEKQQQGFTWWLNFILTPDDFTVKTNVSEVNAATLVLGAESQHKLSVPRAPTKDEMSLRAYTARCRLNRLRRAACRLFTSEKMVMAIRKLETEIEARRLTVRKDRHLWKDVGERQKVLNWLLSYHPLWLRIGLETVFGELLALEDNSDVTGMAVFILNRLLWNPDIAAEYRHPSVPHLYRDGHEEALSKFTLKKLLLLVCFLDHAKISRLIDHDPCLFCKDAEFKTSKDILLAFSRDFLSGEGDLSRHLSWLGLPVSHVQTALDEFDFAVTNLAVDLQCGVRLVRTMELLTRSWDLSKQLRIPAISRLQKMHNVDLALQVLRSRGVELNDEHGNAILSKDIVDRHREKTLALLWKIALAFQVDISVNLDELKEEINFLKRTWKTKAASAFSRHSDAVLSKKTDTRQGGPSEHSESIRLLMEWVNAVCAFYHKQVENFTVSFSDGRVLCYLIHHYHPCCVPLDAICQRTTQTVECAQTGSVVLNSSSESDESSLDLSLKALGHENTPELHKELLENEKKNFQLVRSAVRELGGIPAMVQHSDMSNTIPDEKVVITYLSFLCARLLDLRRETRAARLIQIAWRKYRLTADLRRHQERDKAARIIQSAVISFLTKRRLKKEADAALVIQKYWRRLLGWRKVSMLKKDNLEKVQNKSALVIQRRWRSYSTRKKFLRLRKYSIILQSRIRMIMAVASYRRCLWAAVTVQRRWRARLKRRQDQQRYEALRSSCLVIQSAFRRWQRRTVQLRVRAAVTLQRAFRGWQARKRAQEERSATVIQSWYRMHRELRAYTQLRACVLVIQTRFRGFQARKLYRRKKASVLTIQRHWQAHLKGRAQRTSYLQTRAAAIRLQAAFRAMRARNLHRKVGAACVLQSYWRMRRERVRFLNLRKGIIRLQAHVRQHQQLQKYTQMKRATLVIQAHFRAYVAARKVLVSYQETRAAVIVVQSAYRGAQARRAFLHARACIVRIQAYRRACVSRKTFLSLKRAAVKLQSIVRMKQARKQYLRLRAAALFIQQRYRSLKRAALGREQYRRVRASCIRLQALARGHLVRQRVRSQRKAAISLQSYCRMRKARRNYLRVRNAALVIQKHYRAHRARASQRDMQAQRAATCLQAAFRGRRVRQLITQRSTAARKIQAAFRGYRARREYRRVLHSAIVIQRWYRACKTARALRAQLSKTRRAVVSLQAAYRGWKIRKQIRREHQAALKIQSAFRMARAQKQFRLLRTAALVIQRQQRAWTAGRRQRLQYVELRQAALTLQAAWRRRTASRQTQKRHECAVVIQSYYRMYAQHRKWKTMRKAACRIQTHYRAYSLGRRQRLLYLKTKAAALTLQAAFRRARARRERAQQCAAAAAVIQSRYRAHRARRRDAACRASTVLIQRWYRSAKIANQQRKEYLNLKKAATRVQAVYRGARVRRHVRRMHRAASLIKATFKMHQARTRFLELRVAAVVLQRRYRACSRARAQRAQYLAVLQAVGILQASFRGARVRQTLRRMQTAAVLIQSCYRRHREQTHFNKLKRVTETVQRRYRAAKAGREQCRRYDRLRCSAIRIQAAFRGWKARRHLKVMHVAAALIQRRFRTLAMRRRFLSLRKTAVWVQRRYRAKHRLRFLRLQEAVIRVQSWFRSWMVRKRLREMHKAATVIQATFRMHRAHARYQALQRAAILLQRRYRAHRAARVQGGACARRGRSAGVLQAAPPGMRARRRPQEQRRAAVLAQSTYRTYSTYRTHGQSFFRRKLWWAAQVRERRRAEKAALELAALAGAAACAQAGGQDAKQARGPHQAAAAIQEHSRAFRTRRRCLHVRATAVSVPRRHRTVTAARTRAAPGLQPSCRGLRVPRDSRRGRPAATRIQSSSGARRARAAYQAQRGAAAVIRSRCRPHVRAAADTKRLLAGQRSVRTLPAAFRGPRGRRELGNAGQGARAAPAEGAPHCGGAGAQREAAGRSARPRTGAPAPAAARAQSEAAAVPAPQAVGDSAPRVPSALGVAVSQGGSVPHRRAAVALQLWFRARQTRSRFLLLRKAAVVLQNRYRACVSARRQRQVYLQIRSSIIVIQARTRGFLQKRKFQKMKDSALKIQAVWRRYKARKYACEVKAACKIQAWYRCWKARQEYLAVLGAVRAIQGCFRAKQTRTRFLNVRASTIIVQRRWRAILSGRVAREHFLMMKSSEPGARRGLLGFTGTVRRHLAAVRIQRAYRRHLAAVRIQRAYRRHLAAVRIQRAYRRHLAAVRIQRAYRRHLAARDAAERVKSAICIQRWFRTRLQLKRFMQICHSVINIQHEAQQRLGRRDRDRAAAVIQRAVRRFLLRKRRERAAGGIVKLQALWRGYSWRKKNDCTEIRAIRRSLQIINEEIREEDKLCKRTAFALHHLLTYKHLSAVLEALKHLEVVTRLSPLCCESMAQSGAIAKIFVLIRSCNRSVPCMEVVSLAVQVLLHVAKYEETTSAVYGVDLCVDTLLELLKTYREKPGDRVADKSGSIFTRTCCLLAVLLKATDRASDVRNRSKVVDCVYSIYKLTARKHKISTERILRKQNKNSSISISTIPETPVRTSMVARLKPDWVLRRDNVEEITNPLQAVQMVMDTLGIPY